MSLSADGMPSEALDHGTGSVAFIAYDKACLVC